MNRARLDGLAQRAGARPAAAHDDRALRHDVARRRAVRRRRPSPEDKLEIASAGRRGIDRIEAGFPRSRRRLARRRVVRCGSASRGLGLLPRRPGRCRGARRARRASLGDREPISDAKLEALGVSREKMLERIRGAARSPSAPGSGRVLRRRLLARRPRLLPPCLRGGGRGGRPGGRRRRHDRDRDPGGRRLPRRADGRLARRGDPGALARARRLRPRHRGCDRRRAGRRDVCRGRSTGWASGPGTPTWSRSRSRSRPSTGSRPVST